MPYLEDFFFTKLLDFKKYLLLLGVCVHVWRSEANFVEFCPSTDMWIAEMELSFLGQSSKHIYPQAILPTLRYWVRRDEWLSS